MRTLSEELTQRGFINQFSAESVAEIVDGEKRCVYHGIDPSADSAHAGNFVNWILLRHLIGAGHKVIFLIGGGTGRIGDPKPDAERELASYEVINERVSKLKVQAVRLLGTNDITFVDNNEWLGTLNLIGFLRDIGKHFTVNELLKKDAISTRLSSEIGLSYTEFAYPLLQAYDYLELHRRFGCDFQVGGSDQWGNIIAGVDLVRRIEQKKVYALTIPLVVDKATGKKFGKSEGNAVWLDSEKTSPYAFYQFWLSTSDESVIDYLKLFTFLPLEDIAMLDEASKNNPGARSAQKHLASEVTAFVHGKEVADAVAQVSAVLFGEGSLQTLSTAELEILKANAPYVTTGSTDITELLVTTGLSSSKREARTFVESGAITIDGVKIEDPAAVIDATTYPRVALLKRGKKQLSLFQVVS